MTVSRCERGVPLRWFIIWGALTGIVIGLLGALIWR
jgi:hypothetical protein